ncbi:hypothetical protein ABB02_00633 [Clostridiaceae bacterium JG1575]|nr:hypothetical protein ABB02_00633 [Clostridiaceae bacterium JG1575]
MSPSFSNMPEVLAYEKGPLRILVHPLGARLLSFQWFNGASWVELLSQEESLDPSNNADYQGVIIAPRAGRYLMGTARGGSEIQLHSGPKSSAHALFSLTLSSEGLRALWEGPDETVDVLYRLQGQSLLLEIALFAKRSMLVNPTSHLYFSLDGAPCREHRLTFSPEKILKKGGHPLDDDGVLGTTLAPCPPEWVALFEGCNPLGDALLDDWFSLSEAGCTLSARGIELHVSSDATGAVIYTYDFPFDPKNKRKALALELQDAPQIQGQWLDPELGRTTHRRWIRYHLQSIPEAPLT